MLFFVLVIALLLISCCCGLKILGAVHVTRSRHIGISSTLSSPTQTESKRDDGKLSRKRLDWRPEGYKTWMWNCASLPFQATYKVNYVEYGDSSKPPLLLIHGFGASVYHWRYNIPVLAEKYHIFAIDLLGFGLSEKPIITYTAETWRDQALSFIREVVRKTNNKPVVIAGNSLGGFTALYSAAVDAENLIKACILVNAAGSFTKEEGAAVERQEAAWIKSMKAGFQRVVIGLSFVYTKQPARIAQVLRQVYPADKTNVDDELVESIRYPAQDPNAAEVFYRVIKKGDVAPPNVDVLVKKLKDANKPLLLGIYNYLFINPTLLNYSIFLIHNSMGGLGSLD